MDEKLKEPWILDYRQAAIVLHPWRVAKAAMLLQSQKVEYIRDLLTLLKHSWLKQLLYCWKLETKKKSIFKKYFYLGAAPDKHGLF